MELAAKVIQVTMYTRILIPVDGSKTAEHVLPYARTLARTLEIPVELMGRVAFPRVGELPYLLTLGPHGFYWFELVDT